MQAGTASRDNPAFRWSLALGCVVLIAIRETDLLANPRFWGEEGSVFYAFARHHTVREIFTTPQVGYLTLFNSIVATLQAKVFRAEAAAIVSTYAAFLVQLVPVFLVAFTSHPFWSTPARKLACVLAILLATPPELWLTTTNSHFVFGLITFLVMVIPANSLSRAQRWLFRGLLVLGALSGPASMLVTPAFVLKAYVERSREKSIQAAIQVACAVVQGMTTVYCLAYQSRYPRLVAFDWRMTVEGIFADHFSLGIAVLGTVGAVVLGILVAGYVGILAVRSRHDPEHRIFLLSFLLVAVFSTAGSLHLLGSPRYGYVPTCILLLLLTAEASGLRVGQGRWERGAAVVLLALSLALNASDYRTRITSQIHSIDHPSWQDEVARWRADPTHKPRIRPTWEVEM
jgi:hypothetical protein